MKWNAGSKRSKEGMQEVKEGRKYRQIKEGKMGGRAEGSKRRKAERKKKEVERRNEKKEGDIEGEESEKEVSKDGQKEGRTERKAYRKKGRMLRPPNHHQLSTLSSILLSFLPSSHPSTMPARY